MCLLKTALNSSGSVTNVRFEELCLCYFGDKMYITICIESAENIMATSSNKPPTNIHPDCPICSSDRTDILFDPLGIEPTVIECYDCGAETLESEAELVREHPDKLVRYVAVLKSEGFGDNLHGALAVLLDSNLVPVENRVEQIVETVLNMIAERDIEKETQNR